MSEDQFRIPKIIVPVSCYLLGGERLDGEIFLDLTSSLEYGVDELLEFFNSASPFFPLRPNGSTKSVLVARNSVIRVDISQLATSYRQTSETVLAEKKQAKFYTHGAGSITATIFVNLPEEYSRVLDLFNQNQTFFPAFVDDYLTLLNARHIYLIEEIE